MRIYKGILTVCFVATAYMPSYVTAQDAGLIERAQEEGMVVWYSTKTIEQGIRPLAAAFEAKYGIKVEASKLSSDTLVLRLLNEANAGRVTADVFDGSSTITAAMEADLVQPYVVEAAASFPPEFRHPDGLWTASNTFVAGLAINTDLVAPEDIPTSPEDLLDEKWAGRKIVFTTEYTVSGVLGFIGALTAGLGEEGAIKYLEALKANSPVGIESAPSAVVDRLASGEFAICIGCQNSQVERLKERGAPVEFLNNAQPIWVSFSGNAVVKDAPHPNAAKLFTEFTMSEEGQAILDEGAYLVPGVGPSSKYWALNPISGQFAVQYVSPEDASVGLPRWKEIADSTLQ